MHRRRDGLNIGEDVVMYHCVFAANGAELRRDCWWRRPEMIQMKVCRDVLHADAGSRDEKSMLITIKDADVIHKNHSFDG